MRPTLYQYADDEYSQNGEDGILREILSRLDISSGWFCEFGAWDGKHLSNCYRLLEQDWQGVMIEADEERYSELETTAGNFPDSLVPINSKISLTGENSLDNILEEAPIPQVFELLSIDVDGEDYHIWESLHEYRPKVVTIEYNPQFATEIRFASDLNPGAYIRPGSNGPLQEIGNEAFRAAGTSFRSMVELGERKGYTPVSATEINLIFVDNELINQLDLPDEELEEPSSLFLDEWTDLPWWKPNRPFYMRSPSENVERLRERYREGGVSEISSSIYRAIKRDVR